MIAGIFHSGSGLGDQLFRYITVRTLAEEKGYDWGMYYWKQFKGLDFLSNVDYSSEGKDIILVPITDSFMRSWNEKEVRDAQGNDIRSYDPEINFVETNTIIDGSFEDSKYWHHNLEIINQWLKVKEEYFSDDWCFVGFRGGEYTTQPDLFLGKEYYEKAFETIEKVNTQLLHPNVNKFQPYKIHTDDSKSAEKFFYDGFPEKSSFVVPNEQLSHSKHSKMAFNWGSARAAKYAIIPNSAFFILPRLLKHLEDPTAVTIAPRWWARRNTKGPWRPAAYYKEFRYL